MTNLPWITRSFISVLKSIINDSTEYFNCTVWMFFSVYNRVVCSALQASQPDELTIDEQEMLEVIEDGDMEDWVKVHKYTHVPYFYTVLEDSFRLFA